MRRSRFRRLVERALDEIPDSLWERVDNVDIQAHGRPSTEELASLGLRWPQTLLGLYIGRPLTNRGFYGETTPDIIKIYQEPIEQICHSEEEVVAQVRETVLHEIAHHFGIDDDRLDEIGITPAQDAVYTDDRRQQWLA